MAAIKFAPEDEDRRGGRANRVHGLPDHLPELRRRNVAELHGREDRGLCEIRVVSGLLPPGTSRPSARYLPSWKEDALVLMSLFGVRRTFAGRFAGRFGDALLEALEYRRDGLHLVEILRVSRSPFLDLGPAVGMCLSEPRQGLAGHLMSNTVGLGEFSG